jgi:phosphoglycolate phosphatase-like HAD superfamily hydrolase
MVKELEDSPRDEVAVLLDGDPSAVVGSPPDSTFDVAVRVAGSILLAQVRRGRRCVLLLNTAGRETQSVSSEGPEWQRALELLAAAEPDAPGPAATLLRSADDAAARSLELVVVTSRVEQSLVNRLLERAVTRRPVALVHVEPRSFAGRERRPEPALLRLQSAGVPIAVVCVGDDLAAVLNGASAAEAARA